jgi:hypothetical protein
MMKKSELFFQTGHEEHEIDPNHLISKLKNILFDQVKKREDILSMKQLFQEASFLQKYYQHDIKRTGY